MLATVRVITVVRIFESNVESFSLQKERNLTAAFPGMLVPPSTFWLWLSSSLNSTGPLYLSQNNCSKSYFIFRNFRIEHVLAYASHPRVPLTKNHWPCGLMDKALLFGSKDCRFESCQGHSDGAQHAWQFCDLLQSHTSHLHLHPVHTITCK